MHSKPWEALLRGARWRGWWQPDDTALGAVPVLAARGAQDGPTVVLTGAVHGDEYEGPAAIHRLFHQLDPNDFGGRVIGLPIVNMAAYRARSRTTPADGIDLNRTFPGRIANRNANGDRNDSDRNGIDQNRSHQDRSHQNRSNQNVSVSSRLAAAIFTTFITPCDILIDLHSGGAKLRHLPMVGWYAGDATAEQIARTFHRAVYPWLIPGRDGVLSCEAHRAGKIAVGAEWGGGAQLDPAGVAAYCAGIERLLYSFLPNATPLPPPDDRAPIAGSYQEVAQGGLFVPTVVLGDRVHFGDPLGMLYDELGETVSSVAAERAGLVAALAHNALLDAGDRVAYLG